MKTSAIRYRLFLIAFILLPALVPAHPAMAETQQDTQRFEQRLRPTLKPAERAILESENRFVIDYGYWVNYLFTDYKDDDNNSTASDAVNATHAYDHRFWMRFTLRPPADGSSENEQSVYLRLKDRHTWRDPRDENGSYDWDGPHVDYLFASLDWRPVYVEAGRRYFQVGQGISYGDLGDGVELTYAADVWNLIGFASQSLPHQDNLDQSVPDVKNSGRKFYAVEGNYIGIIGHGLRGYVLTEIDEGDENPENLTQDFDYNATYLGFGSEGTLVQNIRYAVELIGQWGSGFASDTNQKQSIHAWAMDGSVTYDLPVRFQPTLYAEYAVGSGDVDRVSVTDTIGGNSVDSDTSFNYFGYLPTGYALAPRLSNLQMIKAGFALKPLEAFEPCKDLTVSVDYFRFYKQKPSGGIFDPQASLNNRDIGHEIDFTLTWQILSDLTLNLEFGFFEPDNAYPASNSEPTRYFSIGTASQF